VSGVLTRRRFLLLIAASAGASAAAWRLLVDDRPTGVRPTGVLAELFDDYAAARAVGREYLKSHAEEEGKQRLIVLLSLREDLPPAFLRERMRAAVRADYTESRVVLVGGWYLSFSEARLCALTASD
jgi:hypothetical protein